MAGSGEGAGTARARAEGKDIKREGDRDTDGQKNEDGLFKN